VLPAEAKRQLLDAGFKLLSESDDWDLQPGGRYFFTRNMSCLVAFAIGEKSVTPLRLLLTHIISLVSIACTRYE
jgi:aspartyl aminopeptidase